MCYWCVILKRNWCNRLVFHMNSALNNSSSPWKHIWSLISFSDIDILFVWWHWHAICTVTLTYYLYGDIDILLYGDIDILFVWWHWHTICTVTLTYYFYGDIDILFVRWHWHTICTVTLTYCCTVILTYCCTQDNMLYTSTSFFNLFCICTKQTSISAGLQYKGR
jgi:hypothetical protein